MSGIASVVGRPIQVDRNTLNVEWGRFACVHVEIYLSLPVVGKYYLDDKWYIGLSMRVSTSFAQLLGAMAV